MKKVIGSVLGIHLALALSACGQSGNEAGDPVASAAANSAEVVETRQANFKAISKDNKAIKAALEGASPDFAEVAAAAERINANAKKITNLFPSGTGAASGADTEALETIWQKPAEFSAAADKLVTASAALAAAAQAKDGAEVKAAAGQVGASCKGCHDNFRQKKS